MKNIYICGKAGAGKTYCANYLIKKYGHVRVKFAHPVYAIAYNYFGMTNKNRKLLQVIGTEGGRERINQNIWVNRLLEDLAIVTFTQKYFKFKKTPFISDDVRFVNEHEALKKAGWIGIFLNVPDEIRIKRLGKRDGNAQVSTLQHSSETSIDIFKEELIQVDSSESLEATYKNIDEALADYAKD